MSIKVVGIDLAKTLFQVCVLSTDGKIVSNRKVKRDKLLDTIRQLPDKTALAMESCATSHHWGRAFQQLGFSVTLIPAQHVKPFVGRQKNDANDARAICEAFSRPDIHFVPVKSVEQQDLKALRSVRKRLVEQRTALANQIRGLVAEYGIIFPQSIKVLRSQLPLAIEDAENELSYVMRGLLQTLYSEFIDISGKIDEFTQKITALGQLHPRYSAIKSIPGFGPILTAALISEIGSGKQFKNGRQFSAWCGLVPKQNSTGGKSSLGAISKNGNRDLRTLFIHGARAVVRCGTDKENAMGYWLRGLIARRGKAKTIVALANKLGRIAWHVLAKNTEYDINQAFNPV
ncbi:TPA: IS110 family transposase [Vibrio vulnificus]|uniref:IS110 family transposase n=1 Tax=Vibrio vulnificus TaxID=672 RepID=UPI0019D4E9BB|nr:IS110 family transposase [Vibrio vulnificus]MBN8147502.1 IS110 family transposase [Vibrio vulnificus]HAS6163784.1 IS110 family transposase [Vibrio vulnificus]